MTAADAIDEDRFLRAFARLADGYAMLGSRTRVRPVRPNDRTTSVVVAEHQLVAQDAVALTLRAASGQPLPAWSPGAHIDLVLPSGQVRQYSLSGDPEDTSTYRIVVRRLPHGGGGSVEVHDAVTVGTPLALRGPRNAFPFAYPHLAASELDSVLFIAGGIGITALLPMAHAAETNGIDWHMNYVGKSRASMPLLAEVETLGSTSATGSIEIFEGRPPLRDLVAHAGATTAVYMCGPAAMMTEVRGLVGERQLAGVHSERFTPPPVVGGRPFELHLTQSDVELMVPADATALSVLRGARPATAFSCQQGFCGTCRVKVVAGAVEQRGASRFEASPGTMLPCVDRASGERLSIEV